MDPIDKISGAGADPLAALIRQTEAADALLAMKSDTKSPPQSTSTNTPAGPQPQDSIELSQDAPPQINADLMSAASTINLPQLPAALPHQIADALQRVLSTITASAKDAGPTVQPREAQPRAQFASRDAFETPDTSEFSSLLQTVRPERVEHPAQTEQSGQFSKPPEPEAPQTPATPRSDSKTEAASPQAKPSPGAATPQGKTNSAPLESLSSERSPIVKTDASNVSITSERISERPAQTIAPQTRTAENAPPLTLAGGWFTIGSNPTTLAYLEIQRDGGSSNTPEAEAAAQPHFISLDIYTAHVGIVHVRLSLLKSELVGTLSFSAPSWADEANQALPDLVAGLAAGGFRAADLHAIEATS